MRNIDYLNGLILRFVEKDAENKWTPAQRQEAAEALNAASDELMQEPNKAYKGSKIIESDDESPVGLDLRWGAKNFGVHDQETADKLEKETPGLRWMYKDGNLYSQSKSANPASDPWNPLDKTTNPITALGSWKGIKELGADVGDIAADVVKGAGSMVAGTAGTVAGLPLGVGALATGGLAAGSAATGLEGGRQVLSQGLGWSKSFSPSQMVTEGIISGVAAPIAGTGIGKNAATRLALKSFGMNKAGSKSAENIIQRVMAANPEVKEAAIRAMPMDKLLVELGKTLKAGGVLPAGISKIGDGFKTVIAKWSGARPESVQILADQGRKALVRERTQIAPIAEDVGNQVMSVVNRGERQAGVAFDKALEGKMVEGIPLLNRVLEAAGKWKGVKKGIAEKGSAPHVDAKQLQRSFRELGANIEGKLNKRGQMSPENYQEVKKWIKDMIDFNSRVNHEGAPVSSQYVEALNKAGMELDIFFKSNTGVAGLDDVITNYGKKIGAQKEAGALLKSNNNRLVPKVDATTVEDLYRPGSIKSGDVTPLDRIIEKAMTPSEYGKYKKASDRLSLNMDYHHLGEVPKGDTVPTGVLTTIANGLRTLAPRRGSMKTGASFLSGGQSLADIIRNYGAPMGEKAGAQYFTPRDTETRDLEMLQRLKDESDPYTLNQLKKFQEKLK